MRCDGGKVETLKVSTESFTQEGMSDKEGAAILLEK